MLMKTQDPMAARGHDKKKRHTACVFSFCGDPYRIRTDVKGVRGLCLDTLIKSQVLYQLS